MDAPAPQLPATVRTFALLLSSTRRGARLARLLAVEELRAWGVPPGVTERAEQIVGELASNAVRHGQVRGRDFRLALALDTTTGTLRIEITDARGDHLPTHQAESPTPGADSESGRGLLLVTALSDRWGTAPYHPSGKTVWAECSNLLVAQDLPDPGGPVLDHDEIEATLRGTGGAATAEGTVD